MGFCSQEKIAAMLFRSFSCAFRLQDVQVTQLTSDMHGQVTHASHVNVHPSGSRMSCHLFPLMLEGLFSFPTHSLLLVSLPFFLWHKYVSGQVSSYNRQMCLSNDNFLPETFKLHA